MKKVLGAIIMINLKKCFAALLLMSVLPTAHADIPALLGHAISAVGESFSSSYYATNDAFHSMVESNCANSKLLIINKTRSELTIEAIQSTDNGILVLNDGVDRIPQQASVMGVLQPQTWSHGNISGVMSLKNDDGYLEITYHYHSSYTGGICTPEIKTKSHANSDNVKYTFLTRRFEDSPAFASVTITRSSQAN